MSPRLVRALSAVAYTAILASAGPAGAQTVATGPYYAMPSWDMTLPAAQRFIVLANMNSEAVLDRETGLVWHRTPVAATPWLQARFACVSSTLGNRMGWRLPRLDELSSLVDPAQPSPRLPVGHPFFGVTDTWVWSADTLVSGGLTFVWSVGFNFDLGVIPPQIVFRQSTTLAGAWCVRGAGAGVP